MGGAEFEMSAKPVCPECGRPTDTEAPSFFSDRWIRWSIAISLVLLLGFIVRIVSNEKRTLTPKSTFASASPFLGNGYSFSSGTTLKEFRDAAEGRFDLSLDVGASLEIPFRVSFGKDPRDSDSLRMGIARAPYMYRRVQWSLGWPVELVDVDQSSAVTLEQSELTPSYSLSPNSSSLGWFGWRHDWVGPDWSLRVQVTWAALWVHWSFAAIAFVAVRALLHRSKRWRAFSAIAALLVLFCLAAWPRWSITKSSPMGFARDQTIETGISVAELKEFAATTAGRREFASRIDRLAAERFRFPPGAQMTTAPVRPSFKDVVMKGRPRLADVPPGAMPVFFLDPSGEPVREAAFERKSWDLVTISGSDFWSTPETTFPTSFSIGKYGYASLVLGRTDGFTTYSIWLSRLAIELGTMLAIPAALLLGRSTYLWKTARVRTKAGACQICGYDLRKSNSVPASA